MLRPASRCSAGTFRFRRFQRFPPLRKASACRAAHRERRYEPGRRPIPRPFRSRDGFARRHDLPGSPTKSPRDPRRAPQAPHRLSATDKRRPFLPPTVTDGPTLDAPDCVADEDQRKIRADAERQLHATLLPAGFGWTSRVAFRPSPHPRIRWTVASPGGATCACRDPRSPPSRV